MSGESWLAVKNSFTLTLKAIAGIQCLLYFRHVFILFKPFTFHSSYFLFPNSVVWMYRRGGLAMGRLGAAAWFTWLVLLYAFKLG